MSAEDVDAGELQDAGIAIAWISTGNSYASSVMRRTWLSLRRAPEWSAWLLAHTTSEEPDPMIQFDERAEPRLMLRGSALSYFVPLSYVEAAREARTMTRFAADLFHDVYAKWAVKKGLPAPPDITDEMLRAVPSRFP